METSQSPLSPVNSSAGCVALACITALRIPRCSRTLWCHKQRPWNFPLAKSLGGTADIPTPNSRVPPLRCLLTVHRTTTEFAPCDSAVAKLALEQTRAVPRQALAQQPGTGQH